MSKTCCFTGHRIIPEEEIPGIISQLHYYVDDLYSKGYYNFGVGGALGFDTLAAEWLLDYKKSHSHVRIIEVLPFPSYRNYWTASQQAHAAEIDHLMDKIVYCCNIPSKSAFLVRDRHLVDCSSACISYCTRTTGGTAYTVKYALSHHIPVYNTSIFDIHNLL